jgi:hypothetical protein
MSTVDYVAQSPITCLVWIVLLNPHYYMSSVDCVAQSSILHV